MYSKILKKLKANDKTKELPVIMATAKGSEFDKVQSLDCGADDYLSSCAVKKGLFGRDYLQLKWRHKITPSISLPFLPFPQLRQSFPRTRTRSPAGRRACPR